MRIALLRVFSVLCMSLLLTLPNLILSNAVHAQLSWVGGTGDWNTGSNWSLGSPPFNLSSADISNNGTAQLSNESSDLVDFDIAANAGSTGTLDILSGGKLSSDLIRIGMLGTGTANVTDGLLKAGGNSLFVGSRHSDSPVGLSAVGMLNLNAGGSAISGDDFQIGSQGTGTVNFNTGSFGTGIYTVVAKYGTATWNQAGGVYAQSGGDFEIGDGGKPNDDVNKPGPRMGTMNITGGAIHVAERFAISNRIGTGVVNISGGGLAITGDGNAVGDSRSNKLNIGRGADWSPSDVSNHGITDNHATLRVTGDDAVIAVGSDLTMDLNNVLVSSNLIAEITGPTHTPILIGRNAEIQNGNFIVELDGYSPVAGDQWSILQTNVDLTAALDAFDAIVAGENASFYDLNGDASDAATMITHNNNAHIENATDTSYVGVDGPFKSVDFSAAPLGAGLSFELEYLSDEILLKVVGDTPGDFNSDGNVDGTDLAIWETNYGVNDAADTDGDSDSDGTDFLTWQRQYTGTVIAAAAATSAVPEPATAGLLALAALGFTAMRRRK